MYVALVCRRSLSKTVDWRPHYAQGCWHAIIAGVGNWQTAPHMYMSVHGENTTPISLTRANGVVVSSVLAEAD